MIIIERYHEEPNPRGGSSPLAKVKRKVFADNDIDGVQSFLDEREISGYECKKLQYKYIKL